MTFDVERSQELHPPYSLKFVKLVQCIVIYTTKVSNKIIIIIIITITDLYSAFRCEDTEALNAAQED